MRKLAIYSLGGGVEIELCDLLNEEGVAPCDLEDGNPRPDAAEIEGFVMALKPHPRDKMRNTYQMFKKGAMDEPVAIWDDDMWI